MTRAQPRASRSRASLTTASRSVRAQTSTVGPAPEIVAPSAPSAGARSQERRRLREQVRAVGLVDAVAQAGRDEVRGRRAPGPRSSRAACPRWRRRPPAAPRRERRTRRPRSRPASRDDEQRRQPGGRLQAPARPSAQTHNAAVAAPPRRCPGWPSISRRSAEHVGAELEQVVGGEQPGHDTPRRSSPSPPDSGMSERIRNVEAVGGMQALEAADAPGCAGRGRRRGRSRPRSAGLRDLELQVQRQRRGDHVEARPEVGRGGRDADEPARFISRARPARRRRAAARTAPRRRPGRARSAGP